MKHVIAIIEDDDFLRSLAVSKLEKEGFTVTTASNGQEGLSMLEQQPADVLILDLMLPVMSGFQVLESIKKNELFANMKVIVFSNLGEEADIKKCMELGAHDYLVKANFTLDELVEKIQGLVK